MRDPEVELETVPARDWTDDEWIAAMHRFEPSTHITEAEGWVALQRQRKNKKQAR